MKSILFYTGILICFVIAIKESLKTNGPECNAFNKGYTKNDDTVDTILTKLEWTNNYRARINYTSRFFMFSVVISFLSLLVSHNRIPNGVDAARSVLITCILLIAFNQYILHHSEKFPHYAIGSGIKRLKTKLGARKTKLKRDKTRFLPSSPCWNFFFKTYLEDDKDP